MEHLAGAWPAGEVVFDAARGSQGYGRPLECAGAVAVKFEFLEACAGGLPNALQLGERNEEVSFDDGRGLLVTEGQEVFAVRILGQRGLAGGRPD
jgi:hypothetical protein